MNYARSYPRFWLTYFVASVVMLVANAVYDVFARFGSLGATSIVGTALAVIGLRPLYGYVRQRRYDPRWLWKALLVFYGVVTLAAVLICLFVATSNLSPLPVLAVGTFVIFGGPYLLALHQYIYRSPHLWATDLTNRSSGPPAAPADFNR